MGKYISNLCKSNSHKLNSSDGEKKVEAIFDTVIDIIAVFYVLCAFIGYVFLIVEIFF